MPDQRAAVERWLAVAVFAPIGWAVERRQRIEQRVQVARWIGEMTVTYGRRELLRRLDAVRHAEQLPAVDETPVELVDAHLAERPPEPFEGYDSLPASALVQRLGRLPHGELHLVRAYETANRGRRTVLAKVDLLLGD